LGAPLLVRQAVEHPRDFGREPQRDSLVVGTGVIHERADVVAVVTMVIGRRGRHGPGLAVRYGTADSTNAVDSEQALAFGAMAIRGEVPRAERVEHALRIDPARRHLVARVR